MEDLCQMREYIISELSDPKIGLWRRWDMQSALRYIEGRIAVVEKRERSAEAKVSDQL